jgi:hypothetical protein
MTAPEAVEANFEFRVHGAPLGLVEWLVGENRRIPLIEGAFGTVDLQKKMFRESPEARALGLAEEVIQGDGRNGFEVIKWKITHPEDDDESETRSWVTDYGIDLKLPWVRTDAAVRAAFTGLLRRINNQLDATEQAANLGISHILPEAIIASRFISDAAGKLNEELAEVEVMRRLHTDPTDSKAFRRTLTWREADLAVHYANELGHRYGLQFQLWETHPNPEEILDENNAVVTFDKGITYGITLRQKWPHGAAPLTQRMDLFARDFLQFINDGKLTAGNSLHQTDAGQEASRLAYEHAHHIAAVLQKTTPVA